MKKIFTALFIFIAFSVYAESGKGNDLLQTLTDITSFYAEFHQINTFKEFGDDEYSGKVYIVMKEKALWDYTSPYSSWYLITKDTVDYYDEINNQLMKMNAKNLKEYVLLQVLMDFKMLNSSFTIKQTDKNTLHLSPKKDVGIAYMNIIFKDNIISELNSKDNAGNITKITFNKVELNKKISDKVFKKKLPKNVNVFNQ